MNKRKMNKMELNILLFVRWLYSNKQIDVREEYAEFCRIMEER